MCGDTYDVTFLTPLFFEHHSHGLCLGMECALYSVRVSWHVQPRSGRLFIQTYVQLAADALKANRPLILGYTPTLLLYRATSLVSVVFRSSTNKPLVPANDQQHS